MERSMKKDTSTYVGIAESVSTTINVNNDRRSSSIMRKYYRAVLIVVALISVVALLFYRHEYNRLRYVLEVLNFFPGLKESNATCSNAHRATESIFRFDSPMPAWQRLNDDFYVYSAYHTTPNEVNAIAFGTNDFESNIGCRIHFHDKSVDGRFGYSKLESTDKLEAAGNLAYASYYLVCKYDEQRSPERVSFYNKGKHLEHQISILSVRNSPRNLLTKSSVICVAPPTNDTISRTDMLAFVSFHQTIGVDEIVLYDYGISSTFIEAIKNLWLQQNSPSPLTILPWNFPYKKIPNALIKNIVEMDCLRRSYNRVMYSVTMFWEEYMVLRQHQTLPGLFMGLEKSERDVGQYEVETKVFCTEQKDNEHATGPAPMILKKNRSNKKIHPNQAFYISKPHLNLNAFNVDVAKISTGLLSINRYQKCSSYDANDESLDESIMGFVSNMLNEPLFKSYIAGTLFPDE